MGNCMTNKSILAQDNENEPAENAKVIKPTRSAASSSAMKSAELNKSDQKKETVSFSFGDKNGNAREIHSQTKNVVRVRVVVTQEELKRILNGEFQYSCPEQLLTAMESRSRSFSQVQSNQGNEGMNNSWRPALESIPEEH